MAEQEVGMRRRLGAALGTAIAGYRDKDTKRCASGLVAAVEVLDDIERELAELASAREASALLDRMQAVRVLVLSEDEGVIVGGRLDGWLCWRHPDGQWITKRKLTQERPDFRAAAGTDRDREG